MSINATPRQPSGCSLPAVLLVHGFGSSFDNDWRRNGWVDVLSDLGRRVVGHDLLGHAEGNGDADPASYAGLEEHAFAPAAALAPVDAVGFSLGGLILLRLAADDPSRFRRIAVLGVVGLGRPHADRPLPDVMGALDGTTTALDPASGVFRRLVASHHADARALTAVIRRPQRPLTTGDLHRVAVPTLLAIGDDDFAGPATRLAAELPRASLVELPRTDHFATPSSLKAMDAVLRFLASD
ncbi:alpha/beta fold hydrolase [Dactylosporangium sp. NPDC051485]|uniref:alpha/beta fold hydrolase n=1 Tax=Dactylosporangium sp. NPDC051485 TaxID=3154846 RepID=UPI00342BEA48